MNNGLMDCPYCGGKVPSSTTICPDCSEDLAGLARLEYDAAINYNQALALAREGKLSEAGTRLEVVLELHNSFVPAQVLLAKVYARQGRWAEARASIERAVELAPEDGQVSDLASEINRNALAEEEGRQQSEQTAAQSRRVSAERYLASYQRDVIGAFVLGTGVAAFLSAIIAVVGGRRKRRR